MIKKYSYNPDYAIVPGSTVSETLESLCMSQAELAQRTGRPVKTINEIIQGKAAITAETAIQFEKVLGSPASFWMQLEQNYQERKARLREIVQFQNQFNWLHELPLKEMIQYGWVPKHDDKGDQLRAVLSFFGVTHYTQIDTTRVMALAFRKSTKRETNKWALAAWLRKGELTAQKVSCSAYDKRGFLSVLYEARELSAVDREIKTWAELETKCAQKGVAIAFIRELPGLPINGATYWLKDKPVIQLSLRYKSNDVVWFTFFHEAGHILKHGKKDVFVEMNYPKVEKEIEADKFAADTLIPEKNYKGFTSIGDFSEQYVKHFAKSLKIAPGIVVGRLQHDELIHFSNLNHLKVRFRWSD